MTTKDEALRLEQIYTKTKRMNDKLERLIDNGRLTNEIAETVRSQILGRTISDVLFYNGPEEFDTFEEATSNKNISTHNIPGDKYVEITIEVLEGEYTPSHKSIKVYKHTDRLGRELDDVENTGVHISHDKTNYNKPIVAVALHTVYVRPQEVTNYEHATYVGQWKDLHIYYPNKPFSTINEGEK